MKNWMPILTILGAVSAGLAGAWAFPTRYEVNQGMSAVNTRIETQERFHQEILKTLDKRLERIELLLDSRLIEHAERTR